MPEDHLNNWKRIRDVAASEKVSERTVYNWVRAKKLEVRTREGVKLVDPAAVRTLAAARATPKDAASAGNASGFGTGMANGRAVASVLTPELEAQLFERFALGESPVDIVQSMKVSSAVVVAAHKQYQELRQAAAPPAARLADQLFAAEERIDRLEAQCSYTTDEGRLRDQVAQHELRLQAVEDELIGLRTALDIASRKLSVLTENTCHCGAHLVNCARCPQCNTTWDLRP